MFKLIGLIAGYYFLGFFGALLGLFIGSVIDRARAYGAGGMNPLQNALRQSVFIETMFISMGKLAKADGHVSQGEIEHVELLMQHRQSIVRVTHRQGQVFPFAFGEGNRGQTEVSSSCQTGS